VGVKDYELADVDTLVVFVEWLSC